MQKLAKRQAASFRLPTAQAKKSGWWDPPPNLSALCLCKDFFLPGDLQGLWDDHDMRNEKTLALAEALQHCAKWAGGPGSVMCGAAQNLQRCMAHLMQFEKEISSRSHC